MAWRRKFAGIRNTVEILKISKNFVFKKSFSENLKKTIYFQIGSGCIGVVYKCESMSIPDASSVQAVAMKIIKDPKEFNFTKREIVSNILSANNLGPQHYKWSYSRPAGPDSVPKFAVSYEEFLAGKRLEKDDLSEIPVLIEIAKQMARMHSIKYSNVAIGQNFRTEFGLNWNTARVYDFLNNGYKAKNWNEAKSVLAEKLEMSLEELNEEFKFCDKLVQETSSPIVFW